MDEQTPWKGLGIQPNPSSAIYRGATSGADPSSSVGQDADHCFLKPHAEGLVLCLVCSRCQQVLVSVSLSGVFWGCSQALKAPTTRGLMRVNFYDVNIKKW